MTDKPLEKGGIDNLHQYVQLRNGQRMPGPAGSLQNDKSGEIIQNTANPFPRLIAPSAS